MLPHKNMRIKAIDTDPTSPAKHLALFLKLKIKKAKEAHITTRLITRLRNVASLMDTGAQNISGKATAMVIVPVIPFIPSMKFQAFNCQIATKAAMGTIHQGHISAWE
ncbi:MAG: hypothetical protein LUC85_11470 [Bacteroidales bacterium]|nr:hypothetical protein [Bacteroidales bacterium]